MSNYISIVIISYNTCDLLLNCINSIYKSELNDSEIIIVDNGSTDNTIEMLENNFPRVILIKNSENVGFAKANNQAIKTAKGKYIILLNSDTLIMKFNFDTIDQIFSSNKNIAAVGPKVLNFDGSIQSKGYTFPSIFRSLIYLLRLQKVLSSKIIEKLIPELSFKEKEFSEVDWVSGCCMIIPKYIFEKVGLLSEDFFMYYEEVEWCYRANKLGFKVTYTSDIIVKHLNEGSFSIQRNKLLAEGRALFFRKINKRFSGIIITILEIVSLTLNLLYKFILSNNTSNNIKLLLNQRIQTLISLF